MVEASEKIADCCRPLPDFDTIYRPAKAAIALRIFNGLGLEDSEESEMVPLAGLEPALLTELDFESSASTNFTTGASGGAPSAAALSVQA